MDIKTRKSILSHLAQKAEQDSVAQEALNKEYTKIIAVLESENKYDVISGSLELLDTIAYRLSDKVVVDIRAFLDRVETLGLTYAEIPGYPVERFREYHNNSTLTVEALQILEHIRYHQLADILDTFLRYSCHENDSIAKQAMLGVERLSGYQLDIFYGDGAQWKGLGWKPQELVLERIASLSNGERERYFPAIITICRGILSPTISGTSATYDTVTWRTGPVPAVDGMRNIRDGALNELKNLYGSANNVERKKTVLNAMQEATRTPHMGKYGGDLISMVLDDAVTVAEFMKSILVSEDMQVMQKIEHDAYWLLYHKGSLDNRIRRVTLDIRDRLYSHEEFQKFRILIGFESIFHDWEKGGKEPEDYDREREFREKEALQLAESVDERSYNEWRDRIVRYASIRSNDLATFPYFGKFLEHLGRVSPKLAIRLMSECSEYLENFVIAILCGLEAAKHKRDVYSLISRWSEEGKYLFSLARFFEYSSFIDKGVLTKIFDKAKAQGDVYTLSQILVSVSARYGREDRDLIHDFFISSLKELTVQGNCDWVSGFWFRKERDEILGGMESREHKVILDNLVWANEVDFHVEEILCGIAHRSPELVLNFFCDRIVKEQSDGISGDYDAIPFRFHNLSAPLAEHPDLVVEKVVGSFNGDYGLFIYRGARLVRNIFPDFPLKLQEALSGVIRSGEEKHFFIVMGVLRNYEGSPVILDFCKEVLRLLPENSDFEDELRVILQSTGVVSGAYGFVEAYERKIEEIKPWVRDENERIRLFAQGYIEFMAKCVEHERMRADEDIALRKYHYGSEGE